MPVAQQVAVLLAVLGAVCAASPAFNQTIALASAIDADKDGIPDR